MHASAAGLHPVGSGRQRLGREAGEGEQGKGLEAVAQARGISVFQVAIAWLLAQSPVMLPIPGTASLAHLQQNVAAAAIKLSPAELAAIG